MSFNTLHCGAVVASKATRSWRRSGRRFQSPSLRGSGRFRRAEELGLTALLLVSIPFIAGQWSLLDRPPRRTAGAGKFQSPSLRGSGRFDPDFHGVRLALACFNPLHCGAVVASRRGEATGGDVGAFQSPSLRGSGRFVDAVKHVDERTLVFQSPSLRGSGRFLTAPSRRTAGGQGFNPLHCGAVVASRRRCRRAPASRSGFNPLHCGAVVASFRS